MMTPTGFPELDQLLDGGYPVGGMTEIQGTTTTLKLFQDGSNWGSVQHLVVNADWSHHNKVDTPIVFSTHEAPNRNAHLQRTVTELGHQLRAHKRAAVVLHHRQGSRMDAPTFLMRYVDLTLRLTIEWDPQSGEELMVQVLKNRNGPVNPCAIRLNLPILVNGQRIEPPAALDLLLNDDFLDI